jgi:pilus assembly protein CpaC
VGVNLGMLEGSGMARVLAEPSLVTLSGQSANFLAGGEIPIPLSQGNGSVSIEYKPYGVGLTVSPTVLDDQRIVLKVAPESSELDYANAVTLQSVAVPAITTRRADTTVELGDGESFVIGGLVSQATVSSVNRVPLLSQIPVLGTLFKRQEFSRKERELVIVVTPRLVRPFAQGQLQEGNCRGRQRWPRGRRFWGSYVGPSGSSDALPGFSE